MHSFQHGRVVISPSELDELSVDALIVPRLTGAPRGDRFYDAIVAQGGEALAEAIALEATAGDSALMSVAAEGLRADRVVIVAIDRAAQQGGSALESAYEMALRKAFETGALSIGLPLFLAAKDDDAASAIAVIAAFIEAHPSLERVTLCVNDERATYRVLAAAGEYL